LFTRKKEHAISIEKCHVKYSDLAEHAITAKHFTDWPKTKILAIETYLKKCRFLESFFINTNDNVVNNETNDPLPSMYKFAFGVKRRNIVNGGLSQ